MTQSMDFLHEYFQLIQNVLLDAFNVSTLYMTPPYENISKIDQGIRASVWADYNNEHSRNIFFTMPQKYRILIVRSNLGFYNILATLSFGTAPDFVSVGPFRDDELSPNYFSQILKDAHVSPSDIQSIKEIYERMPFVQVDAVVNVLRHLLGIYIPGFKEIIPELIQYSEEKRSIEINSALIEKNSIEHSKRYSELLFQFLDFLKCGDNVQARKALQLFLQESQMIGSKNMRDYKMNLQVLNDYCHTALLQTSIHPHYILKQANSTRLKIENMTSFARLEQMPNEICHKYCLLVKNYANPEYSKLIKEVTAYIQLHLEEELSLNYLASHFKKNPSVLSNLFSRETGLTLTKYIHQTRIQEAIRLFNATDMSVSEVAMAVGYQDFSYFSKVFSKSIGCSPRDYKQQK